MHDYTGIAHTLARVVVTISAPASCAQTPISTRCYAHTMVRQQPQPVAIRSYVGLGVRLLAICESCWHVAELEISALLNRLGEDCTTFDVKARLRCGECGASHPAFQVNGSPEGLMAGHP